MMSCMFFSLLHFHIQQSAEFPAHCKSCIQIVRSALFFNTEHGKDRHFHFAARFSAAMKEVFVKEIGISFGYARVSSKDQNLARQIAALKKTGVNIKRIYTDQQSGKDFDRPNYKKMLRKMKSGDVLYITSIDRLGRNYNETLEQWRFLTKEKGIDIVVIDFPLLDTRKSMNGLTGEFISDITLQILSYVAQMERENIHQRQLEGIAEAKRRGIKFGRPEIKIPKNFKDICWQIETGRLSFREGAQQLGVSIPTLRKWILHEKTKNENLKKR